MDFSFIIFSLFPFFASFFLLFLIFRIYVYPSRFLINSLFFIFLISQVDSARLQPEANRASPYHNDDAYIHLSATLPSV